jgi:nucleoside-diphosphate-sugar epimerase
VTRAEAPAAPDGPCRPVSSYGASKLRAERAAAEAARESGVGLLTLRLGCVYGPGSFAFIPQIFEALRQRQGLTRCLAEVRDRTLPLLYVDDAVAGLMAAEALAPAERPLLFTPPGAATVGELFAAIAPRAGRRLEERRPRWPSRLALAARTRLHRLRGRADLLSFLMAGGWRRAHRVFLADEAVRRAGIAFTTAWEEGVRRTLDWYCSLENREAADEGAAGQSADR